MVSIHMVLVINCRVFMSISYTDLSRIFPMGFNALSNVIFKACSPNPTLPFYYIPIIIIENANSNFLTHIKPSILNRSDIIKMALFV